MIRKSIFDAPTTPRLFVFLQWVREGNLFIPDFQRPFEWDDERRLNLLDSVSRGLPIGAFMIWRTMNDELRTYDSIGPFNLPKPRPNEVHNFLIDGHQRLTTLYAALQALEPGDLANLRQTSGTENWPVYFDLEADDDTRGFVLAPRRRGFVPPETWLPTSDLFVPKALWRRQRMLEQAGAEQLAERIEVLTTAFKDYFVPVLPLVTDDMKAVTDSFVRVNSGGKPMAEDKMLRALAYNDYRIDEHIERLRDKLAEIGWGGLDERIFVNALKARLGLDVYKSTPADIMKAVKQRGDAERLQILTDELGGGLLAAARLLQKCGVPGPAMLPYQYQLICLSEALLRTSHEFASSAPLDPASGDEDWFFQDIKRWVWGTTYSGYFSGITSGQIRAAIDHLMPKLAPFKWADRRGLQPFAYPSDMNLRVEPLETFRGSSTRAIAYVLMMVRRIPDLELRDLVEQRLGIGGVAVVDRIFPKVRRSEPGNIIVTTPVGLGTIRNRLSTYPELISDGLADSYAISRTALHFLAMDPDKRELQELFCKQRTLDLIEIEANFVKELDLEFDLEDD